MSVKLVIDSASEYTKAQADALGMYYAPLRTRFGTEEFRDGVDLSREEFYQRLSSGSELPTTSQPTPFDFEQHYQEIVEAGNEAVVITLSGKLSGTAQSARIAAEPYGDKVVVVDSETVTVAEHLLVDYALRILDQYDSAAALAEELNRVKGRVCVLGVVDTLEYLVRGGRLSKTAGFAGSLLGIKPILTVADGELTVIGKARGARQSGAFLNNAIAQRGGIDPDMPFAVGYSGTDSANLDAYIEHNRGIWEPITDQLPVITIGCAIGTHAGPGLFGVAFFNKNQG